MFQAKGISSRRAAEIAEREHNRLFSLRALASLREPNQVIRAIGDELFLAEIAEEFPGGAMSSLPMDAGREPSLGQSPFRGDGVPPFPLREFPLAKAPSRKELSGGAMASLPTEAGTGIPPFLSTLRALASLREINQLPSLTPKCLIPNAQRLKPKYPPPSHQYINLICKRFHGSIRRLSQLGIGGEWLHFSPVEGPLRRDLAVF